MEFEGRTLGWWALRKGMFHGFGLLSLRKSLMRASFESRVVAALPPAYFALVMATGIMAIAARQIGWNSVSIPLLAVAYLCYVVLWVLTLWRILRFSSATWKDFSNHAVAPGFFTTAAATGVLGSAGLLVFGWTSLAWVLWWLCSGLTIFLIYAVFTVLIVHPSKPVIQKGLNGAWLVAVVAIQSVSVLGGLLAPHAGNGRGFLLFIALNTWLFGGMLYLWIIVLIFYRYMFFDFHPQDLAPPYWINMGAVAISTLAGCGLIASASEMPLLSRIEPFIVGGTLAFWATATWWIPMLLTLGFWRHVLCRFPLRYQPLYWGAIFPLGMYTVCSNRLGEVLDLSALQSLASGFWWVAIGTWFLTFVGMLMSFFPRAKES